MNSETIDFKVTDTSGQQECDESLPSASTVDEVVRKLLADLRLPGTDTEGRPIPWAVSDGTRYLGGNERLRDAIRPGDTIRLEPTVSAG